MDFNKGAVKASTVDVFGYYKLFLELFKNSRKNTSIYPTSHSVVDSMPMTKLFRKSAPLAAVFENVKDAVENLKIRIVNITTGVGKTISNFSELPPIDFHPGSIEVTV
jgi:hypothetical protein